MLNISANTTPLRKSKFNFHSIHLTSTDPAEVSVSLTIPGILFTINSTMAGSQFYSYPQFQTVVSLEHGVIPYVPEIEQEQCIPTRSRIWRELILANASELVGGAK
ncbi:hypothetical protein HG66A1_09730 [Gimesia chilikensis]|uniref:Uncharacterized protein n=1 Tax=Gimesia chilikensis TaxID=2605989 RepID=A0A517PIM5_9PLAN|nr:hypothetical protein HG66A1_09730 [Gimesia chilikensis]